MASYVYNPHPLAVRVILDNPSDREVEDFMVDAERLIRAEAPQLLALGHDIVYAVFVYEDGELEPRFVIRGDGYPMVLQRSAPNA